MHAEKSEPEESHRPRRRSRTSTERVCRPAGWGLHQDLQPITLSRCRPTMHENLHKNPSTKKEQHQLPERQPPGSAHTIITKCFEKLIRAHIISILPPGFDPHQFAYRANRSTDDAIATALHSTLSHLEQRGSYARLLFVDYSSAFNTIIPERLVIRLSDLGLSSSMCSWIMDFLSDRPQRVKMGCQTSSSINLSIGSPQGCVLSPILYSLYTYDCTPAHSSNSITKFADDITVVGLI